MRHAFGLLWKDRRAREVSRPVFSLEQCGFIQTETPYWLEEAYSSAIAAQDVGILQRNLTNCRLTSAILNLLFPKMSSAVDFGAGHGVFVRMVRDKGFNFFWSDLHATNDYARGFESQERSTVVCSTSFEVLEHFTDPVADLSKLMSLSDNVFRFDGIVPNQRRNYLIGGITRRPPANIFPSIRWNSSVSWLPASEETC